MKIKFTCSSFLPRNNSGWKNLEDNNTLVFGEYGDWPIVFSELNNEDILVWILIIEDILSEEILMSNNKLGFDKGIKIIDRAIQMLISHLSKNKNTIVAWASENSNSNIRYAKNEPISKSLDSYLERELYKLSKTNKRLFLLPLNAVFSLHGKKNCFDSRNFYMTRIRFSQFAIKLISESIESILTRILTPVAKVLVLDCDNTIWGGVIGEAGLRGILIGQDGLGKAFTAFQNAIKELSNNGLILCISSKNEEKDVINVLKNHDSMVLKINDISVLKSNWTEKFININEISEELGIGLDSIVFWDDNPIEREKVRINLPQVNVIEPPVEVVEWPKLIKSFDCFADFSKTDEDINKVKQYKAKAIFENKKIKSNNNLEFLSSVNMKVDFLEINESNISRASQLCQKTNQMNLRLIRHDEDSINDILQNKNSNCFLVQLKDDFGDHGIISLVLLQPLKNNSEEAFLDTFLMSCRVLGRELESVIFMKIKNDLIKMGYRKIYAEFKFGERNTPAKELLNKLNFDLIYGDEKASSYSVELASWNIKNAKQLMKIFNL